MKHSISPYPQNIRVCGGHVFNGEKWIGSVERAEALAVLVFWLILFFGPLNY